MRYRGTVDPTVSLTSLKIPDDGSDGISLSDFSGRFRRASANVYFRNLERHLCRHISEADVVVGCVAWLTSRPVLEALAKVPHGVSLVVQKEDFLRPDMGTSGRWAAQLRALYDQLPQPPDKDQWRGWPSRKCRLLLGEMGPLFSDRDIQPVRCMGNHNRDRNPAFPRMHNKFLVFLRACNHAYMEWHSETEWYPYRYTEYVPYAAWTGSFNMTKNATLSFENAVYVTHSKIARRYLKEWSQIMALSEPLDWESDWCQPEWIHGKT